MDGLAERGRVGCCASAIYLTLGGRTALDCYVIEPGRVRVGDRAEVLDAWTLLRPEAAAG